MDRKTKRIRSFWDEQARKYGADPQAGTPDLIAKELEIGAFLARLPHQGRVLDVGCGNGTMTLQLAAQRPRMSFVGVDYSDSMVDAANRSLADENRGLRERVHFERGDVLNLRFRDRSFECVISDRCLINLTTPEYQELAIGHIGRVLVSSGSYFMCENSQQGLARLNELRRLIRLPEIETRWHNLYLDEDALRPVWEGLFELLTVDHFASLYYIASRIFNAKLAAMAGHEPQYDHAINIIASTLPSVGDYDPLRMYVLRRL